MLAVGIVDVDRPLLVLMLVDVAEVSTKLSAYTVIHISFSSD